MNITMQDFIQPLSDEFKSIFFLNGQNKGRYPYSHSLLINDYLFDSGISSGYLRKLRKIYPINNIIFSHWHEDHIAGNRLFPNAEYFVHIKDRPVIEDISLMYEYYLMEDKPEQIELFNTVLEGYRLQNTEVNHTIEDNEIISIGEGLQLKVIHTPGHSAGHCCFLEINSKIAFLGDIDLSSFVWYGAKDSNVVAFEQSIDKLLNLDIETAVTCHSGVVSGSSKIKGELKKYKQFYLDLKNQNQKQRKI
jgi:glyoxylase-like metal-dependent hydrolase (beta-lactamase superfamily II)